MYGASDFCNGSTYGVGNLQDWRADTLLNASLRRSVRMTPSSDDPHGVFLMDSSEAVPNKNDITVLGIPEKSRTTARLKQGWWRRVWRRIRQVSCSVCRSEVGRSSNVVQPKR